MGIDDIERADMVLHFPKFGQLRTTHPLASKIISFGLIGAINSVIDLAIFTLGYGVFGLPLVPANVLAWFVAVSGSYVMNTRVTFRSESSGGVLRRADYLAFVASGVLGMIVTTTTVVLLARFIPVFAAKMASIVAGFAVNFTMSHFVVFRPKALD